MEIEKFWSYPIKLFYWPFCFHSVLACVMNFSASPWQHLLSFFSLCSYTPIPNDLLCHILWSSCHRMDILVHVGCHSIYICFGAFFCFVLCFAGYGIKLFRFLSLCFTSNIAFFVFFASWIFLPSIVTYSLVTALDFLILVRSLIISGIISSSLILYTNCFLSLLSLFYSHTDLP